MTPVTAVSIGAREHGELAGSSSGLYFWLKVAAIISALYFMAGWSFGEYVLAAFAVFLLGVNYTSRSWDEEALSVRVSLLVFVAASAAIAAALWLIGDGQLEASDISMSLLLGIIVVDGLSSSRATARRRSASEGLLRNIAGPVLLNSTAEHEQTQFDPHWGFIDRGTLDVWAIDPAQRAVRRLQPKPGNGDRIYRWDIPILSVEIHRVRSAYLGERDLHVRIGHDGATAWSHVFRFSASDKGLAMKWRDTFEAWMREDRRAVATTASR